MKNNRLSWISLAISIVALVVSMIVLVNYCPTQGITFDYMGVIVGILSLLVTMLIGQQLYSYIYARENIRNIMNEAISKVESDYKHATAARDILSNRFVVVVSEYDCARIADCIMNALDEVMKCDNTDIRHSTLDNIMGEAHNLCFEYSGNRKVIKKGKRAEYLHILKQVDHKYTEELKEYVKLAVEE